ncbi:LysR substrate-binding domain-containing protein [Vreelandella neptunia]|uniref:LysR substrate-binding domain-containing protein n=1 Tax=Vreelandella neptunia TaxID=115551 RepID=UPI003CCA09C6
MRVKTRGYLKLDNGEAVRDACIEGMGVALTSTWCSFEALYNGSLVRILEDHPIATDSSIWALYPNSHLLAPRVRVFINYLLQQLVLHPRGIVR